MVRVRVRVRMKVRVRVRVRVSLCVVQCELINAVHPFQNGPVAIVMGSSYNQKKFGVVWKNHVLHVLGKVLPKNMRGIRFFQTIPF